LFAEIRDDFAAWESGKKHVRFFAAGSFNSYYIFYWIIRNPCFYLAILNDGNPGDFNRSDAQFLQGCDGIINARYDCIAVDNEISGDADLKSFFYKLSEYAS
jgi:hypothetical protein